MCENELVSRKKCALGLQDWARLWRQILKDLRDGVKLKKIEYTKTPIEYELTPYEILMEDIRYYSKLFVYIFFKSVCVYNF